jgi:hypothetical protein
MGGDRVTGRNTGIRGSLARLGKFTNKSFDPVCMSPCSCGVAIFKSPYTLLIQKKVKAGELGKATHPGHPQHRHHRGSSGCSCEGVQTFCSKTHSLG